MEILTEAIFSGKLKPGQRLNESQIGRELRVSRAPIREALQQLQEQGLVLNSPRRGMFVVDLEDTDIEKINSVRLVLEAEAFRLCRARLTAEHEAVLTQLLERLEASESDSPSVRARYDYEFHHAVWNLTGNEYLERTLHSLTAPLFAHSVLRIVKSESVRLVILSHRPLMDFLRGKSDVAAEEVIADHLRLTWVHN